MTASTKRTVRVVALWILALCLVIPLGACTYQQGSSAIQALASTASDTNAEAAETSDATAEDNAAPAADTSDESSAAESTEGSTSTDATAAEATPAEGNASPDAHESNEKAAEGAPTTATIMYYENVSYDDGDTEPDENGRVLLGTYELTDVHVGQTLNAWDYVVDIPGHFFWDGWPQNLTLTENPSDNVINLFYFKLWNNEYTVNYYLMENEIGRASCRERVCVPV